MADHIVKSYDADLEVLDRLISEMGGLAEMMLADAMDALGKFDTALAERVVATDLRVDDLQHRIEESAILTIAKRQPLAIDLRECIAAIRISGDLERVGDLAKSIAKRAVRLVGESSKMPRSIVRLKSMQEAAARQLKNVLDAYMARDADRALAVWSNDIELDTLEDSTFRDLLTFMFEDPRNISFCIHLLFCSKNLERIGDHATNIAETVVYLVTGQPPAGERPKGRQGVEAEA